MKPIKRQAILQFKTNRAQFQQETEKLGQNSAAAASQQWQGSKAGSGQNSSELSKNELESLE